MIDTLTEWFRSITFLQIIDLFGTFAFAISGIRLASAKRFDWFGAYVVGAATAIGGGTLRDVILDVYCRCIVMGDSAPQASYQDA